MFAILGEALTLLFLWTVGSKKDRQELAECLNRNHDSLRQLHRQYRISDTQATAAMNCMLREASATFSGLYPGYRAEFEALTRGFPRAT